ncbi:unnamed protein product [Closterium sp. Naga37s-1]|nr:unnamed protein product [Closterium sp. Naga37s-1]
MLGGNKTGGKPPCSTSGARGGGESGKGGRGGGEGGAADGAGGGLKGFVGVYRWVAGGNGIAADRQARYSQRHYPFLSSFPFPLTSFHLSPFSSPISPRAPLHGLTGSSAHSTISHILPPHICLMNSLLPSFPPIPFLAPHLRLQYQLPTHGFAPKWHRPPHSSHKPLLLFLLFLPVPSPPSTAPASPTPASAPQTCAHRKATHVCPTAWARPHSAAALPTNPLPSLTLTAHQTRAKALSPPVPYPLPLPPHFPTPPSSKPASPTPILGPQMPSLTVAALLTLSPSPSHLLQPFPRLITSSAPLHLLLPHRLVLHRLPRLLQCERTVHSSTVQPADVAEGSRWYTGEAGRGWADGRSVVVLRAGEQEEEMGSELVKRLEVDMREADCLAVVLSFQGAQYCACCPAVLLTKVASLPLAPPRLSHLHLPLATPPLITHTF